MTVRAQTHPILGERTTAPVACARCGWDDDGILELVDRWQQDHAPIPYVRAIEVHSDNSEGRPVSVCPNCEADLDESTVVER